MIIEISLKVDDLCVNLIDKFFDVLEGKKISVISLGFDPSNFSQPVVCEISQNFKNEVNAPIGF